MTPGCEAHHVLILEGEQGIGKSTLFKILGGAWFTDSTVNIGDKDAYQMIKGRWIIELAELDSLNRTESSKAKAFFTSPSDTYRPSYGRATVTIPRQCVFAGTVNHSQFLRDSSGNRRYWPVLCSIIDMNQLAIDRDQLWAEAYVAFKNGAKWYPMTQVEKVACAEEQQQREFSDEWETEINRFLQGPDAISELAELGHVTTGTILEKCLKIEPGRWSAFDMLRVSQCLQRLGWIKFRSVQHGLKMWAFKPK